MGPLTWFSTQARLIGLLAAAGVFLVSAGFLGWALTTTKWDLKRTRADLVSTQSSLAEANTALGVCQSSTANLQQAIDDRNAEIQRMAAEANEAERAGLRKLEEARKVATVYRTRAEKLARAQPADAANVCSSAQSLIVETLSEERAP